MQIVIPSEVNAPTRPRQRRPDRSADLSYSFIEHFRPALIYELATVYVPGENSFVNALKTLKYFHLITTPLPRNRGTSERRPPFARNGDFLAFSSDYFFSPDSDALVTMKIASIKRTLKETHCACVCACARV